MNWKLARRIGFKTLIYFFGVTSGALGYICWDEWLEGRRRARAHEEEVLWQRGQVAREMLRNRGRIHAPSDVYHDDDAYDPDYESHVH